MQIIVVFCSIVLWKAKKRWRYHRILKTFIADNSVDLLYEILFLFQQFTASHSQAVKQPTSQRINKAINKPLFVIFWHPGRWIWSIAELHSDRLEIKKTKKGKDGSPYRAHPCNCITVKTPSMILIHCLMWGEYKRLVIVDHNIELSFSEWDCNFVDRSKYWGRRQWECQSNWSSRWNRRTDSTSSQEKTSAKPNVVYDATDRRSRERYDCWLIAHASLPYEYSSLEF